MKKLLNPVSIIYMLCGLVAGWIAAIIMDVVPFMRPFGGIAVTIVAIYVEMLFHVAIHEGGHLVAGLLSGYKFVSYRILGAMIVRDQEGLKVKRFPLAGTGGQCLLDPPDLVDGKMPYVLYNMGGAAANLLSSLAFLGIWMFLDKTKLFSHLVLIFVVIGIGYAAANGIPMSTSLVNNDGYNAKCLGDSEKGLFAFWMQLRLNALQSQGVKLSEMPEEWFEMPQTEELSDAMMATKAVISCNRLMEQHRFEEALEQMDWLLSQKSGVMGLHRVLCISDMMYCKILLGYDAEEVKGMLDQNQKKMMAAMKTLPQVLRTVYAYALHVEVDRKKAAQIKKEFEKLEKTYPYPMEYQSELELLELAEQFTEYQE